jgi:5'(3')-deoxyribonucleotidase
MKESEWPIALFDLDDTLCDYGGAMFESLEKLRSPKEPKTRLYGNGEQIPYYLEQRMNLIRREEDWWVNLPKLQLGWNILKVAKKLDFKIIILSKGPRRNPVAYSGKKKWIDKNLGYDTDVILTQDKGLVYGRVLVDDFPPYIESWLKHRPRGLVIMSANKRNKNFVHPQVIRYDGTNIEEVWSAMKKARFR